MSTPDFQTPSHLLHAYLDGELRASEEKELFDFLSGNEELRTEMRETMSIRNAVKSDVEAFNPPLAATTAVFAGLGFAIPNVPPSPLNPVPIPVSAPAVTGTAVQGGGTALSALTPLVKSAIGVVVGAALTVTGLTLFKGEEAVVPHQVMVVTETLEPAPELPILPDLPVDAEDLTPAYGQVETDAASWMQQWADIDARQPSDLALAQPETQRDLSLAQNSYELPTFGRAPQQQTSPLRLQMRGNSLSSNPSSNMPSQADPWLINAAFGAFYDFDQHHSIGMEVGREAFPQHYHGFVDGFNTKFEQNPIDYWVTAAYQYKTAQLPGLPGLYGFAQANLGGAVKLGPMGRAVLGVQYNPVRNVNVAVGAEGAVLMYQFQKRWFSTEKLGVTYGLSVQF